jgi:hypothetical protein
MGRSASAAALAGLLKHVLDKPDSPEAKELLPHLGSQGSLARYSHKERGVIACSLNTLKRACSLMPGGFDALDSLRRRALHAIDSYEPQSSASSMSSKRQLQNRLHLLKARLDGATEDLLLLTRLLEKSMRHARQYAIDSGSPGLIERCAREQAELRDMMTLRQAEMPILRLVARDPPNE